MFLHSYYDDNDACTIDSCDSSTGIVNTPVVCGTDQCHTYSCDKTTGCSCQAVNCNDNDACTVDTCYDDIGCINQLITWKTLKEAGRQTADELRSNNDLIKKTKEAEKAPGNREKAQEVESAHQLKKSYLDSYEDKMRPLENSFNQNKGDLQKAIEAFVQRRCPQCEQNPR